jgi:hypothetical protein
VLWQDSIPLHLTRSSPGWKQLLEPGTRIRLLSSGAENGLNVELEAASGTTRWVALELALVVLYVDLAALSLINGDPHVK